MAPTIHSPDQIDLLSWSPPEPVSRFERDRIRSATLAGKIARAVSEVLKEETAGGFDRARTAEAMTAYLGETVSKNMLDAYASEAREEQVISLVRFIGLLGVTLDKRLLQVVADEFGWAVVEKKYLPVIELASLREHEDAVKKRRHALQAAARVTGAL